MCCNIYIILYVHLYIIGSLKIVGNDETPTEAVSEEFTQKTDALLQYISRTYLADGFVDSEEAKRIMEKMEKSFGNLGDEINAARKKEIGFDTIFMEEDEEEEK